MPSVLFVCLGNICRSPAAESYLRHLAAQHPHAHDLKVDSCGIGAWHVGEMADARMQHAAQARGIILSGRAKQFTSDFFIEFDIILAADREVLQDLHRFAKSPEHKAKIHLISDFSESYKGQDIPDPYYRGEAGFELVLDMLEDACNGLLSKLYMK